MTGAALFFHPEAYSTSGPKLMGRNAAGESFLRGFVQHCKQDLWWLQVHNREHAKAFASVVREQGRSGKVHAVDAGNLGALREAGLVYFPGPNIGQHAWERSLFGHDAWSLCGITHTTSSAGAMDGLTELLTAPVQPWDAVICTSTAVRSNVEQVLQAQVEYLQERLGIARAVLPLLPIIPLGINTADFAFTEDQRYAARHRLGADSSTLVVTYMGRLSFHAKAHPLAMYQALELAAIETGKKVVLVECGWHANEYIAKAFDEAAKLVCPSIRVVMLDGREAANREMAWAGGDVFCSLADNIQETFGIVPLEAMAAGLPTVVSDWDGYKDTVRDGVDGFRIPTMMPAAGLGSDLAARHALGLDTYDMYCGHTSSLVAVDVAAAAKAFSRLFESEALRKQLGGNGRERAQALFDWRQIIPRYEELWEEQARARKSAGSTPRLASWPSRPDPFKAFENYPTLHLNADTWLSLVEPTASRSMARVHALLQLKMASYAKAVLPTEDELQIVLSRCEGASRQAISLVQDLPATRKLAVLRALAWLVKLHVLQRELPSGKEHVGSSSELNKFDQ
jgi:starch synthase